MIPKLTAFLAMTDEELKAIGRHMALKRTKAPMLQHYSAPLVDARVSALWSFDIAATCIAGNQTRTSLMEDLISRSRKYFDLTFTKLEGGNFDLIQENLQQVSTEYSKRAERVVTKIRRLQSNEG